MWKYEGREKKQRALFKNARKPELWVSGQPRNWESALFTSSALE